MGHARVIARQPSPRRNGRFDARRWLFRRERLILGMLGLTAILVLWEIASRAGLLNRVIFSSPSGVFKALQVEFERGSIWNHLFVSATEYILGFALAAVVGVSIGFAAGWWRRANYVLDPWITVLYSAPTVALVPMIILIFGIDLSAKVFIVFLISVFSIIVNTMAGVASTGRHLIDVARCFGASERQQITSVVLPGSLPYILTGLRLAGGQATVGVVVAELVAGNAGLGFLLNRAGSNLQSGLVMGLILLLGLWGIFLAELMRRLESRFEAWRA
jgi:ABC-type nitrate/sulfonate/bicarbonate transport system permease component